MDHNIEKEELEKHKIDVSEEYEVQYWASIFHISQGQLKQIAQTESAYIQDIKQYLEQHNPLP